MTKKASEGPGTTLREEPQNFGQFLGVYPPLNVEPGGGGGGGGGGGYVVGNF